MRAVEPECVGDTKLTLDQPSLLFASYDNPDISAVGEHLDQLLAQLITAMDGDAPTALRHAVP
jgi:hypothetical protein